jgi:predicted methyltransferase MtxX (methanogen marker protein 4)
VQNELSPALGRTLNELRTIQYLEETVGPAGLRRLADALPDDEQRTLVQGLRRRAASASLELESILEDWTSHLAEAPRKPKPLAPGGLDAAEMVESFVEVKRASAELLRRAARDAPTATLKERLLSLADEEEAAAGKLQGLSQSLARPE